MNMLELDDRHYDIQDRDPQGRCCGPSIILAVRTVLEQMECLIAYTLLLDLLQIKARNI